MRTIIWFIYFWLYLLLMLPEYWKVKKLEQEGKREEHDKKVRYDVHNLSLIHIFAEMVGVSRNTISSIETGQFNPTAKLALILCIALDKKFEDLFYFD